MQTTHPRINNQLNLIIATIGQIGKSPDSVHQNACVLMMNQHGERWKQSLHDLTRRRRIFAAAQVDHHLNKDVKFDHNKQGVSKAIKAKCNGPTHVTFRRKFNGISGATNFNSGSTIPSSMQ
jgi:hypothetical protein